MAAAHPLFTVQSHHKCNSEQARRCYFRRNMVNLNNVSKTLMISLNTQNKRRIVVCCSPEKNSKSEDVGNNNPLLSMSMFILKGRDKDFTKFVDEQPLPVAVSIMTVVCVIRGFLWGLFSYILVDFLFPEPEVLDGLGSYGLLINSFYQGPFLYARSSAVFLGVNMGIYYAMTRLRGKIDIYTRLVSGFGSGIMLSLVNGMRDSSVIVVGVVLALLDAATTFI